jgi:hypothetical protein
MEGKNSGFMADLGFDDKKRLFCPENNERTFDLRLNWQASGYRDKWRKKGVGDRVARFFLVQYTKMAKNIPNYPKIYLMAMKYIKLP